MVLEGTAKFNFPTPLLYFTCWYLLNQTLELRGNSPDCKELGPFSYIKLLFCIIPFSNNFSDINVLKITQKCALTYQGSEVKETKLNNQSYRGESIWKKAPQQSIYSSHTIHLLQLGKVPLLKSLLTSFQNSDFMRAFAELAAHNFAWRNSTRLFRSQ